MQLNKNLRPVWKFQRDPLDGAAVLPLKKLNWSIKVLGYKYGKEILTPSKILKVDLSKFIGVAFISNKMPSIKCPIRRKPRERLRDAQNISAYDG